MAGNDYNFIRRPDIFARLKAAPVDARTREQQEYERRLRDLEERMARLEVMVGLRDARERVELEGKSG
jgi:transcription elongation GreA/GreB family factor